MEEHVWHLLRKISICYVYVLSFSIPFEKRSRGCLYKFQHISQCIYVLLLVYVYLVLQWVETWWILFGYNPGLMYTRGRKLTWWNGKIRVMTRGTRQGYKKQDRGWRKRRRWNGGSKSFVTSVTRKHLTKLMTYKCIRSLLRKFHHPWLSSPYPLSVFLLCSRVWRLFALRMKYG